MSLAAHDGCNLGQVPSTTLSASLTQTAMLFIKVVHQGLHRRVEVTDIAIGLRNGRVRSHAVAHSSIYSAHPPCQGTCCIHPPWSTP